MSPQRSPVANAAAATTPMSTETVVTWFGVSPRWAAQRAMYFEYGETKYVVKKPSAAFTAESSRTLSSSCSRIRSWARSSAAGVSGRAQNSLRRYDRPTWAPSRTSAVSSIAVTSLGAAATRRASSASSAGSSRRSAGSTGGASGSRTGGSSPRSAAARRTAVLCTLVRHEPALRASSNAQSSGGAGESRPARRSAASPAAARPAGPTLGPPREEEGGRGGGGERGG